VSASLVGAATAFAKVGASLAPMVGFYALPAAAAGGAASAATPRAAAAAHAWQLLVSLPAACVGAQLALLAIADVAAARDAKADAPKRDRDG
jgi:hypothetical protein